MPEVQLTWDDKVHSIGIRKMDDQHKQLLGLIAALHNQRDANDPVFFEKIFATLVQYTQKHFGDEEAMMKRMSFPGFVPHKKQHAKFFETVTKLKKDFDNQDESKRALAIEKLTKFLSEWLTHHILVEDRGYAKHLEG